MANIGENISVMDNSNEFAQAENKSNTEATPITNFDSEGGEATGDSSTPAATEGTTTEGDSAGEPSAPADSAPAPTEQEAPAELTPEQEMEEYFSTTGVKGAKKVYTKEDDDEDKKKPPFLKDKEDDKNNDDKKSDDSSDDKKDNDKKSDDEEDKKKKKDYQLLEQELEELKTNYALLESEMAALREFKAAAENEKKDELINSFYMLSNEDKKEVIENKANYSLDDIEAKLSVICVRKKVNFDMDDNNDNDAPTTYNLESGEVSSLPAWLQAVEDIANNRE